MANEPLRALQWITTTLTNDATFTALVPGGVWRGLAPQGTPTPYCVLSIQSAPDLLTFNGVRIWNDALILVKVVGPAAQALALQSASDRVDALLDHKSGASGGSTIFACVRESAPSVDEVVNDVLWSNFSGAYRVKVK